MRQWWCRKEKRADGTCLLRGHVIQIQPSSPRQIEPFIGRLRNIWKTVRPLVYGGCREGSYEVHLVPLLSPLGGACCNLYIS